MPSNRAELANPETKSTWSLVTAPDEQQRCCVVIDGARCEQPTAFKLAAADGAWDDYTYVCGDHVELVRRPDSVVERVYRNR